MTARALRALLRQRKKELRQSLRQRRQRAEDPRAVRRRRIRRAGTVAVLILLMCLMRCECHPGKSPPAPKNEVEAKAKKPVPPKPGPLQARVNPHARGSFDSNANAPPSWLEAFHLQVSARSPKLAECFTGAERPGALRWTAAVNPESGAVSDHNLEAVGAGTDLRATQRDCLIGALSRPTYRLHAAEGQALPNRVSLVIEF